MTNWEFIVFTLWETAAEATLADPTCMIGHCCGAVGCTNVARWRSYWPGRESVLQCERHKGWSAHVADALGFNLHAEPVPVRELNPAAIDYTAARFAAMELE